MKNFTKSTIIFITITSMICFIGCDMFKTSDPEESDVLITINSNKTDQLNGFVFRLINAKNDYQITSKDNTARFQNVKYGMYSLTITKTGYETFYDDITINTNTFTKHAFLNYLRDYIQIRNSTGNSVRYCYFRIPGQTSWNYQMLNSSQSSGSVFSVDLPLSLTSRDRYDMCLSSSEIPTGNLTGTNSHWWKNDVLVSNASTITFSSNDQTTQIYITLTHSSIWVHNLSIRLEGQSNNINHQSSIGGMVVSGGISILRDFYLPVPRGNGHRVDFYGTNTTTNTRYRKLNQYVTHGQTYMLTFTSADAY